MLTPPEIARSTIETGIKKSQLPWWKMLVLGIFAGMFIALAGAGATFGNIYGGKIAGACIFTAGLAMVIVAGSELFTGNNLMVLALFDRKISLLKMLKNWLFVFIGNILGAGLIAAMVVVSSAFDSVADIVIATATTKTNLGFFEATLRGILCNFLVCIAVWMSFSATTTTDKILSVFFPIMLFVLCGFEHSIANCFFIPAGMMTGAISGLSAPSISDFLIGNLLPVTIGNIIGGTTMVGIGYYLVYVSRKHSA